MSIELSMDSSSYLNQPKSNEELESPVDLTPRSTGRRTTRNRPSRQEANGFSDSDFTDDEDSPRKGKLGLRSNKKGGKGMVMRDESGRPLSPAEARRQRKRVTNRESARRMRLLRKEEWNKLQQEVHDKTTELQKVHHMNQQMNEGYAQLELKCRNLSQHNQALVDEVMSLVGHLRESIGKEMDNRRLAAFLRNMAQLVPAHNHLQASAAPAASSWVPTDHKPMTFEQSKTSGGQIHITATTSYDGCATPAYEARALGRSAGSAVLPDAALSPAPRMSKKCSAPIPSGICERSSMMYEPESFRESMKRAASEPAPYMEERPIKKTRNCETPPAAMSASMSQHPLEASRPLALSVAVQQEEDPAASPERPEAAPTAPVQRDIAPSLEGIHIEVTTQALPPPSFESTITHHLLEPNHIDLGDLGRFPSIASMDAQFYAELADGGLDKQMSIGKLLGIDL